MKILVCLAGVAVTGSTWALPQYQAEEIIAPSGAIFHGLNSFGTLVGRAPRVGGVDGIIRLMNGTTILVSSPPGFSGYEVNFADINDAGQISGTLVHGFNGTGKGFVYTVAGGFKILNSPDNEAFGTGSMTNDGWAAFGSTSMNGLWNPETNERVILSRPGMQAAASRTSAVGANWIWSNGEYTDLQGDGLRFATTLATSGQSAGYQLVTSRSVASIWNADGSVFFSDAGLDFTSSFQQITTGSIAVGGRRYSDDRFVGTFFSPVTGVVDANELIVHQNFTGTVQGMHLIEPNGLAMGRRLVGDELRHILLTPVPEPGTMLALGAGLAALLRRRRSSNTQNIRDGNVRPDTGGL